MPGSQITVRVSFRVTAENVREAQAKVREIIEHGREAHDGAVEWSWAEAGK